MKIGVGDTDGDAVGSEVVGAAVRSEVVGDTVYKDAEPRSGYKYGRSFEVEGATIVSVCNLMLFWTAAVVLRF